MRVSYGFVWSEFCNMCGAPALDAATLGRRLSTHQGLRAYRPQGLDFVTNTSPMHPPFHLYEFTRQSFVTHGERAGHRVADSRVFTGDTFLPRVLNRAAVRLMAATDGGMVLELWLTSAGCRA
jgi:hypothetical protein